MGALPPLQPPPRWINLCLCFVILAVSTLALDNDDNGARNSKGLFPNVFNLAATSVITVNATCGESGAEVYCKLVEHVFLREEDKQVIYKDSREPHCAVCDGSSPTSDKRHPISHAIDGTNRWWQSPTLQNGKQFEWVTITLDLGQVYQVAYVIVKAAISPRPGNWILERSLDGIIYKPWQYYAVSDTECWEIYGIRPTIGKPYYRSDDEVICTSYYSKLNPLENGEIHTSLVNGRPGVDGPSNKLREFTKSRYVRLRLQKIRTLNADLMTLQTEGPERTDQSVTRRYFYSIKDISVGGQCVCFGHAENCSSEQVSGRQRCKCEHNTCGENCERCCPLYNQKPWRPGIKEDGAACEQCECFGHAEKCHYDENVAKRKASINIEGIYEGGGVCDECKHHTVGINCDRCEDGYFRPANIPKNHPKPCRKCHCIGPGMTGNCVKDDSHLNEGLQPGHCLCKAGFSGINCDHCDVGYRNFPLCEPCPCHSAGTVGGATCEGDCLCKSNVEGSRCDRCKHGYYYLSADNPDGCSQCFCYGITDQCTEGDWGVELIQVMEKWRVTDLNEIRVVKPTPENGNLVIANDDMAEFSSYYWLAPPDYLGKKLYSYGADLKFTISYVVARGDTSGTYTESADVILEGNGMKVGHNWGARPDLDEVSITLPLREQGWFTLTPAGDHGGAISRESFTLVLNKLTKLLIRAKFHTDQIEGRLHNIGMEIASKESQSLRKLESVEKCLCPPGYAGLSCEYCASGYRQINDPGLGVNCERCDCYNHAESCHPDTGRCQNCLHHTRGTKCDRCQHGYYGDATVGTPGDCKRCACPLEQEENNFSPTCVSILSDTGKNDYKCNQCPQGYEGDKCEKCAEGYFGIPQIPGGNCQRCDCSENEDTSQANWCDGLTGQCIKCLGNTAGWNCGECLPGYYGSAEHRTCEACSCNTHGSLSAQCDHSSGQCLCKPHVVGRTCNRCADGYGNIEAGCVHCRCNEIGSRSQSCDPVTGHCFCKPGVFGTKCDSCLEGHFGFSVHGCQECNCNPLGAHSLQCDERNGQCSCKHYVTGRACDRCEDGYWNLNSGVGCENCHCNQTGSTTSICDKDTGHCRCKPGVGGKVCDQCLAGHYRYSVQGCRRCDPCDIPGHICDPNNGRCVCPPHTTGRRCQQCVLNAWGYDPVAGCKPCDCSSQGSPSQTCDPSTGNCICLEGFEGHRCDQCRHGFYNFPNCHKCNCNEAGTDSALCQIRNGVCQCNEIGQCPCKEHVTGRTCEECEEEAFGLSAENSKGCHQCFCFGRIQRCRQANMVWTKLSIPERDVFMEVGNSEIPTVLGFQVIPEELRNRRLGIPYVLDKPLYWKLPKEILGDKVLSYNGYLTFQVESQGNSRFPDTFMQRYPLLVLQGNHRIVLVHSPSSEGLHMPYRVKLHEDEWKILDNPQIPVNKKMMMIALQNLQVLLIRGTDGPDVRYSRIQNISLDVASSAYQTVPLAVGVEMCRCPRQYTGSSCQDPATGFYRKHKPNYLDSKDILDLVGWAEPCSCNNHSNICERETGICIDCTGNTMGSHCDQCIKGYYGDPSKGPCRPCACPHLTNSFSDTCVPDALDYICVDCQSGYAGRHCEKCASGYYGDPLKEGGHCTQCKCNPYGSRNRDCDPLTGLCHCHEGISGRDCTVCSHGFILTEYGCKSCEDECTGILLGELYQLRLQVEGANLTDIPTLPWSYLNKISQTANDLKIPVADYERKVSLGKELVNNFTFYFDLETKADLLRVKADGYISKGLQVASDAKETLDEAEKLLQELNKIRKNIQDLTAELQMHGLDPSRPGISVDRLLLEAERILGEIQSRNFEPNKEDANRELRKAIALLNNVKALTVDHAHVDDLREKLNLLDNLLKDIIMKIDGNVKRPIERAAETVRTGRLRQNEVQSTVDVIASNVENSNKTLKDAADLLSKARSDIIDAAVKSEFLPRLLRDLENATDNLEKRRSILSHLNSLYKYKYVIPAQEHANDLEKQSQYLASLFTATRELSEFPLQAAKAYQTIIDALNAAEIAAREADKAAERAYFQAYPQTDDALTDQAEKAKARSLKLLMEAQKLSDEGIPVLEQTLRGRKTNLDELAENIAYGQRSNDIINRELDNLPKGVGNSLQETIAKQAIATDKANDANKKVDAIIRSLEGDLAAQLEAIRAGTIEGFGNLTKTIQRARANVKDASRLADNADASSERVRRKNSVMKLNLKELKDKILLARQKASSIRVSLSANNEGECVRSFKPVIEPSTTNNIILNYAISNNLSDSLLFYIGSVKEEDFMAIEMVKRKIRFLWNAGGGTQVIQHNMAIETNSEQFLKNGLWFKIEANRIGNLGTLSVKKTPDGQKPDPFEVSGASPVGYTKMDLDSSSYFFIGGLPENYPHHQGVGLFLSRHALLGYECINERFLTAKFQTSVKDLNVICCYAPTEDADEKDRIYGQLQDILNSVKKGDITLVLGDFNAKVGTDSDLWGGVIGLFGIGSCNGNGQRLLQVSAELRTSSFAGCLYEVIVDGKQVGLWNFLSNKGCDGCKEGATEDIDVSAYEFQGGNSYAIVPMIPYYKKNDLYAVLSFKTLNEDGLLFLSCNPKTGEYISLELKSGKVVYQLQHASGAHIMLQTANKYNTGKWTRVEAAREKFEAQILVEEEFLEKTAQKQDSSDLNLKDSSLYYGGVPPNFTTERWHGITFASFFGCLKDLQIDSTPLALSQGSFYGMRVGCSHRAMKVATFKGAGYLELNGQSMLPDSSFSFSFLTHQRDALLLLSTFSGQQADANMMKNYYSVALEDGKIKTKLDSGIEETFISSDRYNSDGKFHTITIIRKNRRLFLRIDDVEESEIRLPKGIKDISSPKSGGLFFGGVKESVDVNNMAANQQHFMGIIKDAVFNDRLLRFEEAVDHNGVSFGISDLESKSSESFRQIILSHPGEECTHESMEKEALNFSNTPHNHFELELDRKDLSRDFNITFEILTYEQEGLFIAAKNDQKKQHFLVSLENNHVVMEYRKRKEQKMTSSYNALDHGKWHVIQVIKFGKTISLYINNKKHHVASMTIPKRLMLKSPLYIGGMPQKMKLHTTTNIDDLKGCIRNVRINSIRKDLPAAFGSCFENKELGFYLTGDGYITYDSEFYIGRRFEISLQFQTTENNGMLISMFSSFSGILFKLKLLNKSISVTMHEEQHSKTYQLTQDFEMPRDSCNRNWHTVLVTFNDTTLSLKLDELKPERKIIDEITEDLGSTSLYIGGSPRNIRPFVEKEQHFNGCLRNIYLNRKFVDVEEAESFHNVIQQQCPQR